MMRTARFSGVALVLIALAGCSSDLTEDLADGAPVSAADAAVAPAHVVYLAFDGLTLTKGAIDDPAANVSRILEVPSFTAPPLFEDLSMRDARLALVAESTRTILSPYNIEVVTERPSSGDYDMVVFGGDSEDAGFPAGIFGNSPFACNEQATNITYVFETGFPLADRYTSLAISAFGVVNNIPITDVPGDCMCQRSFDCLNDELCTIGGAGTSVDPAWTCESISEVDVEARFLEEFGAAE